MKIAPGSKLVMIGDSITDCGRARPVGEGGGLGQGYVAYIDVLLSAALPAHRIRILNVGTGGNTARDLKACWQRDVLDLEPDWLSVMIGINDVWRQFDCPRQPETHVPLDEYRKTLDELLKAARPHLKGLVLMTPYFIELNRKDAMRAQMDRYGAAVKELAGKHKAIVVDTQAAFDALLAAYYPATIASDRVHLNPIGHMALARAFLKAVGFEW